MLGVRTRPDAEAAGVSISPLAPNDGSVVEEVFAGLSADSRFARYHTGTPTLPSGVKALLRRIDGDGVVAQVARGPTDAAIGLVWLIRTGDSEAELAIEVVDAWQGRGIGSRLLSAAELTAAKIGIDCLRAEVLGTNRAAVRLLRKSAPHARVESEGPELVFEWEPGVLAAARRAA
jgi:ribosomal protein S18 acetylase RimI-like enzyme